MDNLWIWLGGSATPLKSMRVNWDYDIPNIWKIENVQNHQPVMKHGTVDHDEP